MFSDKVFDLILSMLTDEIPVCNPTYRAWVSQLSLTCTAVTIKLKIWVVQRSRTTQASWTLPYQKTYNSIRWEKGSEHITEKTSVPVCVLLSLSSSILFPFLILFHFLLSFPPPFWDHTHRESIRPCSPHWQKPRDKLKRRLPCFNLSCFSSVHLL